MEKFFDVCEEEIFEIEEETTMDYFLTSANDSEQIQNDTEMTNVDQDNINNHSPWLPSIDDSVMEKYSFDEEWLSNVQGSPSIFRSGEPLVDETDEKGQCYICQEQNTYRFPCNQTHGLCYTCAAKLIQTNCFPLNCPYCYVVVTGLHCRISKMDNGKQPSPLFNT